MKSTRVMTPKTQEDFRRLRRTYLHLSSTEQLVLSRFMEIAQGSTDYSLAARVRLMREAVAHYNFIDYDRESAIVQGRIFGLAVHALLQHCQDYEWFPVFWEAIAHPHAREVVMSLNPGHDLRPTTYPFKLHEHWMRVPRQRAAGA